MSEAASTALIVELESAVKGGSSERRLQMLRQVTDLFLSDADRLNENQIGVFDDVLVRLMEQMETRALAQLGTTLSGSKTAPRETVRQLAYHEEVSVAAPVLTKSARLSEGDLIEIANLRGPQHLLAISHRDSLSEGITDVLLRRGDQQVSHALAKNAGARFSEFGYATLVESSEKDDVLAEKLGLRIDIPLKVLRELLSRASAAVRDRLLKVAPPEMRAKIQEAIRAVVEQIASPALAPEDYTESESMVLALNRAGKLGDQTINRFAMQGEYNHIIAALSLLNSVKTEAIEPLIGNPRPDGLIVACKAARLNWSTTSMILRNRPHCRPLNKQDFENGREVFDALSLSSAQRTIRFWSARGSARKADAPNTAVAISDI
ncbi:MULTISPECIES: DUF2336 domain-containing protein [unclassified Nitrobacter]|uniref:DUF2336 domain-containing protein n=1 Tax=unclassified Nitrobacter TaxID=2620411 RepID=UPI0009272A1A|nr:MULTISPECIES: DUF2336 domain-containing protein [unclassified Nitrobacter]MBN9149108.1 DUF2336 domain-containing protein [Nitrobacter sp.]OJV00642.1 MAG: hypothetical protein BGO16_11285 [Nitrobacter sp. 62-23]